MNDAFAAMEVQKIVTECMKLLNGQIYAPSILSTNAYEPTTNAMRRDLTVIRAHAARVLASAESLRSLTEHGLLALDTIDAQATQYTSEPETSNA